MAQALPEDVKKRAEKVCERYGDLTVQDPGTMHPLSDGRVLVFVKNAKGLGLWVEVPPTI